LENKTRRYSYRFRPGCYSRHYLIEFLEGTDTEDFGGDLLHALAEIHPKINAEKTVKTPDQTLYFMDSQAGEFTLSSDTWGVFLMGDDNQAGIQRIHNLLIQNDLFIRIQTDNQDYT